MVRVRYNPSPDLDETEQELKGMLGTTTGPADAEGYVPLIWDEHSHSKECHLDYLEIVEE